MSHLIKGNPNIRGIKMYGETEQVISQFADDTALFLMYTKTCINEALKALALVEANTGLKVSYEKTNIYRIGSLRNSNAKCYTAKLINWSNGDIELLGVMIYNSATQPATSIGGIYNKLENVIQLWYYHNLNWIAKILIINTLMASLFTYQFAVCPF